MTKPQYHPSGLETWSACGEQFRRRYIEGEKTPPPAAMVVGCAVDRGVRADLGHKIETGELLPTEAAKDAARDALESEWQGEVLLDEGESKGSSIDKTVGLAGLHHSEIAPALEPTHVARKCVLEVEGCGFQLAGEIDVQEGSKSIRDTKTRKRPPVVSEADNSLQLTAYSLFAKVADGRPPDFVALDVLVETPKTKKRKTVILRSTRDQQDYQAFLNRVAIMDDAIKKGVFHPARQDDWRCSEKWCGYFDTCRYARSPKTVSVPDLVPVGKMIC